MSRPKLPLIIGAVGGICLLSFTAFSQTPNTPATDPDLRRFRFSHIRNMGVENVDGQTVGKVSDLIADRRRGKLGYCLLVSKGFLGLGSSIRLVPVPNISMATAKKNTLALTHARANWQAWPELRQQDVSHFVSSGEGTNARVLISALLNKSVSDPQQRRVGKISDFLVDLSGERPMLAIISAGGAFKRRHFAIALNAFHGGNKLTVEMPATALEHAPWLTQDAWRRAAANTNQPVVYRYNDTQPDNTAQNSRDIDEHLPTPDQQSQAPEDLQITQSIRRALATNSSLSFTAKNVKIITADNRVTLRGPVRSPQEKELISRVACEIAGPSNVVDQMEIERK